jgi:hypothetical protein
MSVTSMLRRIKTGLQMHEIGFATESPPRSQLRSTDTFQTHDSRTLDIGLPTGSLPCSARV